MATNTLAVNVEQAISDFSSIKTAIVAKGVTIPNGTPTSDYASKITSISSEPVLNNVTAGNKLAYFRPLYGTDNQMYLKISLTSGQFAGDSYFKTKVGFSGTVRVYMYCKMASSVSDGVSLLITVNGAIKGTSAFYGSGAIVPNEKYFNIDVSKNDVISFAIQYGTGSPVVHISGIGICVAETTTASVNFTDV